MNLLRGFSRRKLVFVSSFSLLIIFFCGLLLLSEVAIFQRLPGNWKDDFGIPKKKLVVEYNLPSLEDVIHSVVDEDLQRVLEAFKSQHDQIPKETQHVKVVLASTWRSGSTLLGEIISSFPGAFYHYEPLMLYGMNQFGKADHHMEALDLLESLLNCNYNDKVSYLNYSYGNSEMFVRNTRLWHMCSSMPRFKCYVSENLDKLCSLFPVQVMKLVRARLEILTPLLEDNHLKIIWLTRDPRAIIHSRVSSVTWCVSKSCKEPKYLCEDLLQDFNTYLHLRKNYPNQMMIVRYEDLAEDPYNKTKSVLEFIGLSMHQSVREYLNKHLSSDFEAPWSTIHNPQMQAKKWMKNIPWNNVAYTQYYCREVMKLLGYRAFDSETEMSSGNAVQILNMP